MALPPPKLARAVGLTRLLRLARPEATRLVIATFFLAIGTLTGLAYPQGVRYILDEALGQKNAQMVDRAALAMAVIFAVQGVAFSLRYILFQTAGERVVTKLRQDLFQSLLGQEVAFFDGQKTGELTNRLSADTTVLQSAVSANISMALRHVASVIGGVALLLYTSPILTALMLLVVPPVALSAMAYGRRVRALSRDVQDALAKATDVAVESLGGVRTVRAFAAEPVEVRRYTNAVQRSYELARKRVMAGGVFIGIASTASFAAGAAVFWYGGRLVIDGRLTVGALTSFLLYTMMVAFSLGGLSDLWADFNRALGAADRVFELLDRKPAVALTGGLILERTSGRVHFADVHFAYPSRSDLEVLKGLDLTLDPGEAVALVGPSGAGKSTVGGLLYRLYDPTSGTITLDGHDVRELDPSWLRKQVGVVSQEPLLFSTTIAENIRYGRPDATDDEVEAAARASHAHEFVETFPEGYKTPVGERGIQLSGGQKQRVAIARAMLKNPKVLLLDEATSALDAESEYWVQKALERLMEGRTTLIIAHRLSTVARANRVLVLEGGRVVQSGPHASLIAEGGLYRKLVERQFAGT